MPASAAVTSRTTVPDRRPARRKHAPAGGADRSYGGLPGPDR
jgi:hypothetical protein